MRDLDGASNLPDIEPLLDPVTREPAVDNTTFLLTEGLPLLSAFRLIESRETRQAILELVKKAAGPEGFQA